MNPPTDEQLEALARRGRGAQNRLEEDLVNPGFVISTVSNDGYRYLRIVVLPSDPAALARRH